MKKFLLVFFFSAQVLLGQNIPSSVKYLALGDSYTIGQSVPVHARWPIQLQDSLQKRGINAYQTDIIATTGWTTSSLLSAMNSSTLDKDYNLVSILIGVNNFYQGQEASFYRNELPQIIDKALEFCQNDTSAIFMVTIPDYGYTPFGQWSQPEISANTNAYNAIKDSIGKAYGIPTYNITPISREGINDPSLVASDKLHPSEIQYTQWVNLILENFQFEPILNSLSLDIFGIKLYRNNNQIIFSSDISGTLEVIDISGKVIVQQKIAAHQVLEMEALQHVTIFKFYNGEKYWTQKVGVQ